MSNLSRRTLVASAAALPALAVPAAVASACALPSDLVERFLRARAWHLKDHVREIRERAEFKKKFFAASGVTDDEFWEFAKSDPGRFNELMEVHNRVCREGSDEATDDDAEVTRCMDERWAVAKAMLSHEPKSIVDLAYQAEAWLLADLELLNGRDDRDSSEHLLRTLFRHIRALGALPQPADPSDALTIGAA